MTQKEIQMSRLRILCEFAEFMWWRVRQQKATAMNNIDTHGFRSGAVLAVRLTLVLGAAACLGVVIYLTRLL